MEDSPQDNVIKFPVLQKMMNAGKSAKKWLDDKTAEAQAGLRKPFEDAIRMSEPQLSEEEIMEKASQYANMAQSGGTSMGSLVKVPSAGGGIAGVKQLQDLAQLSKAPVLDPAAKASRQIIGAESANIKELSKQLAAKRQPRWGK